MSKCTRRRYFWKVVPNSKWARKKSKWVNDYEGVAKKFETSEWLWGRREKNSRPVKDYEGVAKSLETSKWLWRRPETFWNCHQIYFVLETLCYKIFSLMSINFMISTPYIEVVIYDDSQRIGKTMLYQHVFVLVHVLSLPTKRIHIRITSCKSVMFPLCTFVLGVVLVFYSNRHCRSAPCS